MQHVKLELTENFGVTVSKVRNFNHSIASFSIFDVKDAGILLKIKGIYIISNIWSNWSGTLSIQHLSNKEKAKLAKQWAALFPCLLSKLSFWLPATGSSLLVSSTRPWKRERPPLSDLFHSLYNCMQSVSYSAPKMHNSFMVRTALL